ncbi:MAG: tRNA glutamyl-Q(34) synthetase GluQRS [Halioglobus sp.]|nr:tRNA glutamyl-Q(34) synthetase GluQRS [Halioglobus sp.]
MPDSGTHYRGRFAPSPTGPLHLGSLIAALASFLDARHCGGHWLLRMEDLDPPREQAGAAADILHSLRCHGLHWDGDVLYQSARTAAYEAALDRLAQGGHLFHCDCTRAALGPDGSCQRHCRDRSDAIAAPYAIRTAVPAGCEIQFSDRLQGTQRAALGATGPDFVVKRKDGLYAYQLAVVVDDAEQGITHVVRGSDLLDSTPRQIFLQQLLGYNTPQYCHLPVITTRQGQKFSKQNLAPALVNEDAVHNLRHALRFLRQSEPPAELDSVDQVVAHATAHWALQRVPAVAAIAAATLGLET